MYEYVLLFFFFFGISFLLRIDRVFLFFSLKMDIVFVNIILDWCDMNFMFYLMVFIFGLIYVLNLFKGYGF